MTSPYPGNPSPQQPPGGSPYGGDPAPSGSQWGAPPPGPGGTPPPPGTGGTPPGPGDPPPTGGGQPPERKKPWPWIVGICGCLVLVLVIAGAGALALYAFSGAGDDPTEAPTAEDTTEEATTEEPTRETTTEEPSEEPTTEEPTSEEPAPEEETEDEEETGLPGQPVFESTPVQDPDEDDLDAATEVLLDHLNGLSDGDADKTCASRLDPLTGEGITEDSILYDGCIEAMQEEIDDNEWEGMASDLTPDDFTAELDAENRVVLVNLAGDDDALAQIAKGSDGNMYLASF